ncbi:2-oxo acid dehydrogenase subunit E2 [Actinomadura sp. NEAU-AAG7]|uniref:2-oxo acid dehydrogenase subunit E2 n=1 Tax=Actinomadura sp. NEAU-AAG7 TaxID=2839640 RepID=UPI001BE48158|nr:2-oxo acid dehydrogenase subunit E2 [Actinomadura sp. NEAU-AAG7]MBT2210879.1 2-oxo acid dehydrogenase subunit E2 [Actinomadura sp. NEAU-AAG7]
MKEQPLARQRRHTLYLLKEIRAFSPVFLDTEVDMTRVRAHRTAAGDGGRRYSIVSYVLHTAARVLVKHPDANAAVRGRFGLRVARYPSVHGKLTLDRTMGGQRIVLAALLPNLDTASLDGIQDRVDHYREGDPEQMPEFAGVRALHKLPWSVGLRGWRRAVRPLPARAGLLGTLSVTSLGHRPVDGFHSVGGTTVTLGVGRITDRPAARDGQVVIAPTMRLNLAFDHRVIDGAEAADVLAEIKDGLETFTADAEPREPVAAERAR